MGRLVVLQLIAGVLGGILAAIKNRNVIFWSLACFIVPLLTFIISFLPSRRPETQKKYCPNCSCKLAPDENACGYCSGKNPIELVQCHTCGSFVPEGTACPECRGKK